MAGLLDFLQTPAGMGLLSGVASYAANAQRGRPVNSLGRGMVGGLLGYQQAQDQIRQDAENALTNQYRQFQMEKMRTDMDLSRRNAEVAAERAKAEQTWKAGLPVMMGKAKTQVTPFEADNPFGENLGNLANVQQADPQALQEYLMRPESPYAEKLMEQQLFPKAEEWDTTPRYDQAGRAFVTSKTGQIKYIDGVSERIDPNKPFRYGPSGEIIPNAAYQQYELRRADVGAPRTSIKIDNKTGESLAGQVGPMVKDSRIRALGAVKMADSAERLEAALNSGKVIAGPLASQRMFMNQVGSAMGITGPDAVTQTRQVIRALAESSVEARKELQGQGQVTENEAKAVEKAMSGNIDDMTVPELKALVTLNKKAAKFTVEQHKYLMDEMNQRPELQGVSKFYDVPGMERVMKYQSNPQGFQDADKERRYQEWKQRQGK